MFILSTDKYDFNINMNENVFFYQLTPSIRNSVDMDTFVEAKSKFIPKI